MPLETHSAQREARCQNNLKKKKKEYLGSGQGGGGQDYPACWRTIAMVSLYVAAKPRQREDKGCRVFAQAPRGSRGERAQDARRDGMWAVTQKTAPADFVPQRYT